MFHSIHCWGTSDCILFVSVCILETLGEGTADSAFEVNPPSADSYEGEAMYADPEIATTAQLLFGFRREAALDGSAISVSDYGGQSSLRLSKF
jgi:hypothetical protein